MIVLLILGNTVFAMHSSGKTLQLGEKIGSKLKYTPHNVIRINNDTDFANQAASEGWPGDGSQNNPYIISGYDIDAHNAGNAIYIGNTTVYFIIRNCRIRNATHATCCIPEPFGAGVRVINVKNGEIRNNTLMDNIYGIILVSSSKNIILNNTMAHNWRGVVIQNSSSNILTNNNISGNMEGVQISHSSNITILKNDVSSNYDGYGIFIENSYDLIISQNNVLNNLQSGLEMHGVSNSIIINNTFFNDSHGISLTEHSFNNTVEYNTAFYNEVDINIESTGGNIIAHNSFGEDRQGILIDSSQDNIVVHNHISNNTISSISLWNASYNIVADNIMESGGISISGNLQQFLTNRIDKTNKVNGRSVYFLKNASVVNIPSDAGEVILANCRDITIENLNLNNVSVGIIIAYSSLIKVSNNTLVDCPTGIYIQNSFNNSISNNKVSLSFEGIDIFSSNNNTIKNNRIFKNDMQGIFIYKSSENVIENNNISNNRWDGIYLWRASSNIIVGNNISRNRNYGVYIDKECSYNIVYGNLFLYNHGSGNSFNDSYIQARDDGSGNYWNSSSGIGNYWLDWANNNDTNDNNGDGIVDWPYPIDGSANSKDYYPLKTLSSPVKKPSCHCFLVTLAVILIIAAVVIITLILIIRRKK